LLIIEDLIRAVPHFDKFVAWRDMEAAVLRLAGRGAAEVEVLGRSEGGRPIHHVTMGRGRYKALFVGYPHPNEPIGGLTVLSLLDLLSQSPSPLGGLDVEWHVVPSIDPDGMVLNEAWTQKPFSIGSYVRGCFRQEPRDQVERSFPIEYKKLLFDAPIPEVRSLMGLMDRLRPDFYYSLHNARLGGVVAYVSKPVDEAVCAGLTALWSRLGIPVAAPGGGSALESGFEAYAPGVREIFAVPKYYDYLESRYPNPEDLLHDAGACSWDYLREISPGSLSFIMELPYLRHPMSDSRRPIGRNLREEKLVIDAKNKALVSRLLDLWRGVEAEIEPSGPLYRKVKHSILDHEDEIHLGLPSWETRTEFIVNEPRFNREMVEADLFGLMQTRMYALANSHELVRVLESTPRTPAIEAALDGARSIYDVAIAEIDAQVDNDRFEMIDLDALVRAQLVGGLIALESDLRAKGGG